MMRREEEEEEGREKGTRGLEESRIMIVEEAGRRAGSGDRTGRRPALCLKQLA